MKLIVTECCPAILLTLGTLCVQARVWRMNVANTSDQFPIAKFELSHELQLSEFLERLMIDRLIRIND